MLWLMSFSLFTLVMTIAFFSYFYQKSFSTLNKTSKVLTISLAFLLFSTALIILLFYFDVQSIHSNLFRKENNNNYIMTFITSINIISYILIPLIFFYLLNNEKLSKEEGKKYLNKQKQFRIC